MELLQPTRYHRPMLRYLACFACAFAAMFLLLRPTDSDSETRHADAARMLKEAQTAKVSTVSGTRFYHLNNRYSPDGLYWRPPMHERSAQCIRCPLSLRKVAKSVDALDYLRLSDGRQIIIALRKKDGQPLLERAQVIAILEENEAFARQKLKNPAARSSDWVAAATLSLLGAGVATLAYLAMRLRARNTSSTG
jgi:HAMP domain-containing protein